MLKLLRNDNQESEENIERKRPNSQRKYQKAPDIITQVKPNSIIQPMNPHQSAFTPSNRSNKLNSEQLLLPPKSAEFSQKKTLILDLDETLVHSSFTPFEKNDIILNIDFEGTIYKIYVLVRPDAELFINEVGKLFEVVIFTASISKYASPLLDILDKGKNIKYRLYRDHCTFINGIYIKDLKKCNRNLKDLMIVDNSPIAYTFDSDNGIPIKTWIEDPEDKELMKLLPILEFLSKTKDVRVFIDRFVYNNKILYDEAAELIKMKELIDKNNIDNNISYDSNNNDDKFTKNIKIIPKENIVNSHLNQDEINKNNFININNNNKHNYEMEIRNRNVLKLQLNNKDNNTSNDSQNTFHENGFNTTKNVNKLNNNINFIENNKSLKKNKTNIYNINNNNLNIKVNKISTIKPNNPKKGKNNVFRFKATERQQQQKKIASNNKMNNNNKLDPSLPLTLLLSNIAKRILTPKASYQENSKNRQKPVKNNMKPIYNPNENNDKSKKKKYINLLEQYKTNNKITISLVNNPNNPNNHHMQKKMKNNYSMKNINYNKPSNIRVSSSINNYLRYIHENKLNKYKEKNGTIHNKVTKSKSTENFLIYSHTIKHPKTPKEQHRQRIGAKNKNVINFFEGINNTKTTNRKNINFKDNYGEIHKMKKK